MEQAGGTTHYLEAPDAVMDFSAEFSAEDMADMGEMYESGFDHSLSESIAQAEIYFGTRTFSYAHKSGTYSGTAAQILDSCPHAQTIAGQGGFESFASWVVNYETLPENQPPEENEPEAAEAEGNENTDSSTDSPQATLPHESSPVTLTSAAKPEITIQASPAPSVVAPVATQKPVDTTTHSVTVDNAPFTTEIATSSPPADHVAAPPDHLAEVLRELPVRIATEQPVITAQEPDQLVVAPTPPDADISISELYMAPQPPAIEVDAIPETIVTSPDIAPTSIEQMREVPASAALEYAPDEALIMPDIDSAPMESEQPTHEEIIERYVSDAQSFALASMITGELMTDHPDQLAPEDAEVADPTEPNYKSISSELLRADEFLPLQELFSESDELHEPTYENLHETISEHQDIPLEVAFAELETMVFDSVEYDEADEVLAGIEQQPTNYVELVRHLTRLRIEIAYAKPTPGTTFEQLPESLQSQLLDLLTLLGYANPYETMSSLLRRQDLTYVISFILHLVSIIEHETVLPPKPATILRSTVQPNASEVPQIHSKLGRYVIAGLALTKATLHCPFPHQAEAA